MYRLGKVILSPQDIAVDEAADTATSPLPPTMTRCCFAAILAVKGVCEDSRERKKQNSMSA